MILGTTSKSTRLAGAGILFCLYATGSAWIVSVVGESYRKNHAPERFLARTDPHPLPSKAKDPTPSVDLPEPPEIHPAPPIEHPKPPVTGTIIAVEPKPAPPSPPPATSAPPLDPFWGEPNQQKVWDLDHLTIEDEKQLGADLNRAILRFHKPLPPGPLSERVNEAAGSYLSSCSRKGLTYTFTVLDCDEANVFSHPGGYVYVCRGLLERISEDEDHALQFAMAHEIAHVDKEHMLKCFRGAEVKKLNLATVPLLYRAIPRGYMDGQDSEADHWAASRMLQAGRSRHETMAFLNKIPNFALKNADDLRPLDKHLGAHPPAKSRIKELKSKLDPPAKAN